MSSVDVLLHQFNQICSASSTTAIKTAENRLLQLQKDYKFLQSCSAILQSVQIMPQIKKLIAVYFQKFTKRVCKQKNTLKFVSIIQQLLTIISNPSILINYKCFASNALDAIINLESNKPLKMELASKFLCELKQSQTASDEAVNFPYLLFCGKAIFGSNSFNSDSPQFIKTTFRLYTNLNLRLLKIASSCGYESKQGFLLVHKLLEEYSLMLKTLLKRITVLDNEVAKLLYLPQFQLCITTSVSFNLKENIIGSSVFVLIPNQFQMSRIINNSKKNYINCIISFVRLINHFFKNTSLLISNPLYQKLQTLLDYFIKSTATLLQATPYHDLPIQSGLFQHLDELFNLYVQCLRMNDLYPVFIQNKSQLIEKIALPCLKLTPNEASNFYEDPQEFIQSSIQVVQRNIKPVGYANQKNNEGQETLRQYQTLKTYAAQFLNALCKYQDGTLTHIFTHAMDVITKKINTSYSISTMLMVISCLKEHVKQRKDLKVKLAQMFSVMLEALPIPTVRKNFRNQVDIEYAYFLLAVSKFFIILKEVSPNILEKAFKVGIGVLYSSTVSEVHTYFVFDIFDEIIRIQEGQNYVQEFLNTFNLLLLRSNELSIHLLDSYYDLIKYNSQILKKKPANLLQGLQIVTKHIEKQVSKPQPVQVIINKCWNIIREVGQNDDFLPEYIQNLELIILPLVPYIDGVRNLDFQEDILLLMTSFIDKGKKVTLNQQKMFEIIPKVFYNQYYCRFGQAFHTLQLFIYYGSEVLKDSFPAIKTIIQMSITAVTRSQYNKKILGDIQNCQGALVLQSLVAKCGDNFPSQMWSIIIKGILSRLQRNVNFSFLSANLYALLGLSLVHSFKFFSDDENKIVLAKILQNIQVFTNIEYAPKVMVVALTELLMNFHAPFIHNRFSQILDITISLLEISKNKKQSWLGTQQQQDDEKQYSNALILLKNDIKSLDEFNYFKRKIELLKQQNRELLANSIAQFPQAKKAYLINILTIEMVSNVPRKIVKIKK